MGTPEGLRTVCRDSSLKERRLLLAVTSHQTAKSSVVEPIWHCPK